MKYLVHYVIIVAIGAVLFIPFLGQVHLFDPDEVIFAEAAREMVVTGDFSTVTLNYQPFWEKPPLFIWLQAFSMQIFGVNEFAARLPNAIVGIFTLLIIFSIGTKFFDSRFGWFWVLAYIGAFLPHLYFKSGVLDPLFNLFVFLGIYYLMLLTRIGNYRQGTKNNNSILAGIFVGLAFLVKGPLALLLAVLTLVVYWLVERFYPIIKLRHLLYFFAFTGIVFLAWLGFQAMQFGLQFPKEFFSYHLRHSITPEAVESGPVFYHLLVLLLGCFPASILLVSTFRTQIADAFEQRHLKQWMIILLIIVIVVFSIIPAKMVRYSSLAYFPITFLAAYFMYEVLFKNRLRWRKYHNFLLLFTGFILAAFFIAIPLLGNNTDFLLQYVSQPNARAALNAKVYWGGWEVIVGLFFAIILILAVMRLNKERTISLGFTILFVGTAVVIQAIMYIYVPKVEGYSQRGIINFYKTLQDEDMYVQPVGYPSYAHLFYSRVGKNSNQSPLLQKYIHEQQSIQPHIKDKPEGAVFNELKQEWLLNGEIDKPVIFVAKLERAQEYAEVYNLRNLGSINGYVILSRIPGK